MKSTPQFGQARVKTWQLSQSGDAILPLLAQWWNLDLKPSPPQNSPMKNSFLGCLRMGNRSTLQYQ